MNVQRILERRRQEREELLDRARRFIAELEQKHLVRAAVVFGSVARGDFNLWSDIDLLIVSDSIAGNPLQRLEALGATPPLLQPLVWTTAEWAEQLERNNAIVRDALAAGVWLRGSPDLASRAG